MSQNRLLFLLAGIAILFSSCKNTTSEYITNNGMVFGTYYNIKYESPDGKDMQELIDNEFKRLSRIFSHYDKEATISKINQNIDLVPEPEFINCFNRALEISEITSGAFDITAAPLINAWGFGPEAKEKMTPQMVDSLKDFTGYRKIRLKERKIVKDDWRMQLNMSAIAKGYTCDLIGSFLEQKGCENYMVDIGGEVVAKGKNDRGKVWTIGIREPNEDPFNSDLNAAIM